MAAILPAVCLLLGLLAGLAIAHFMLSARQAQTLAQSRESVEARLRGELGAQIIELKVRLDERARELVELEQNQRLRISELDGQQRERIAELESQQEQRLAATQREADARAEAATALGQQQLAGERELSRQRHEAAEQKLRELREVIEQSQKALSDHFNSLASKALESNNQSFLELARSQLEGFQKTAQGDLQQRQLAVEALIKPISEKLGSFGQQVQELEKTRAAAYGELVTLVKQLDVSEKQLNSRAEDLVRALRGNPTRWGRWGEMQLRNVIELAGMQSHCDFYEQSTIQGEGLRPDVVVRMPGGRSIPIDSKAPLEAYLQYVEADSDEQRKAALDLLARNMRERMKELAKKEYSRLLGEDYDLTILFLPGEAIYSAAFAAQPELIDAAFEKRIMIASPTTLLALLTAVAYGWKQEQLAQNAIKISSLGRELYDRMRVLADHFRRVGKHLGSATDAYNDAVGSIERNVLPQARRFKELGAGTSNDIAELDAVDVAPRRITADELTGGGEVLELPDAMNLNAAAETSYQQESSSIDEPQPAQGRLL